MSIKPLKPRNGGKWYCHKKVIAHFPVGYTLYAEPFVGGGSIYFNTPHCETEVINDLDSTLINAYRCCKEEAFYIEAKTYTEEDYNQVKKEQPVTDRDKIIREMKLARLSFFGIGNFTDHKKRNIVNEQVNKKFIQQHKRLQHTTICNKDYKEIITTYDSPSTFFYLDPPYENSNKTVQEYTDIDLEKLRDVVCTIKGKFLLSLNDSERTRELFKDFHIDTISTYYIRSKRYVNELIIKNY